MLRRPLLFLVLVFSSLLSLAQDERHRQHDLAVVADALRHFEDAVARNERNVLAEEEVERIGPVDAADFVDVAEAFGRDQRRACAFAFQDRVDRDGRPVDQKRNIVRRDARLLDHASMLATLAEAPPEASAQPTSRPWPAQ